MKSFRVPGPCAWLMALALVVGGREAAAATVAQQNLVDLIRQSDTIVIGTVSKVSDGFTAEGVPYTEVTLDVSESLRGTEAATYTFRQFGLTRSRVINGRTYLGTTPDGWPTWSERERVMLFMSGPARLTGLQTTAGLSQGKLRWSNGQLVNVGGNAGLFKGMTVDAVGLSREQVAMLGGEGKAVDAEPFVTLVRRAVDEQWIAKGVMRHAK